MAKRIRELRHERGWNQIDLEAHLDERVKRATLSDFETGRRLPSVSVLMGIAEAFEVEPAALFLDPSETWKHKVALAVLEANEDQLQPIAKLLDIERE
ncbi:MAG: helix-turn-helix transcriptional regulator [Deltaproteobacteria bacterium]|nr:helix-turn-helix transcriptional regulator [Deltaproteobacteria bacterium]